MTIAFLVRLEDGTYARKPRDTLLAKDVLVFDGPDSHAELDAADEALRREIDAAGGLEPWRAVASG